MSNPVLAEAGALAAGQDLAVIRFGDVHEEPTRGVVAQLAESPAGVKAAWSRGGRHAWLSPLRFPKEVEFVIVTGQGPDAGRYRVIYHERVGTVFPCDHYILQDEALA